MMVTDRHYKYGLPRIYKCFLIDRAGVCGIGTIKINIPAIFHGLINLTWTFLVVLDIIIGAATKMHETFA